MMMSCPIQPPASLFCSPAAAMGVGGCAELLDISGGAPQPLLANPHPLFPAARQTTNVNGDVGGCHQQQQHMTTPGAWYFQQSPTEGSEASVTVLGLPDSGAFSSAGVPPGTLSPPPGSLAHQQLLARFGPRHTTESVEVPSSEHVAEIVGRQGCKIKALRAKTNTYIKTPVRGEEPVFVVTGRHEDVLEAKREIECAAEHFTQIRASRRHSQGGCPAPGHVTAYVRVPLRVVGLVVGPKGNTIKRIQQDTHTYIITPSREREPIFEVTGLPQNVEAARREIEQHIYQRTGNMPITDSNASIANYDLHNAALQAQQAALHANASNRPNYGALAITSSAPHQLQQHQVVSQRQQHLQQSTNICHSTQFQHQQHNINTNSGGGVGGLSLGDLDGCFRTQQQFGPPHDIGVTTKFFGNVAAASPPPFGPIGAGAMTLGTSASNNNLHAMLGALELDGGGAPQQGQQHQQGPFCSAADFKLSSPSLMLLRSSSNGIGAVQQQTNASSAFSPWRMPSGVVKAAGIVDMPQSNDFLELLSSTSPSPLFSASSGGGGGVSGGCHSSSYSTGSCVIGGFVGDGLSSVNSTSRDEGLGDSPTNSFGRPNGADPYQHLMTIWADVCDPSSLTNGGDPVVAEGKPKANNKSGGEELKIVG